MNQAVDQWGFDVEPGRGAKALVFGNDPLYILGNLVAKDFKVRYRNMSLGVFWSLVNPLIMMSVMMFVFTVVFERGRPNFPLFLLLGLLPYNFFSLSWSTGTRSIISNANLIKQVPFQRELVPISAVLSNFVHYLLQLALLLSAIAIVIGISWQWLWLPVVLGFQIIFVCGLAMATSALNVYFRDTEYVISAITTVMFWMVPIFYGFDQVDPAYAWLYESNPVAAVLLIMRRILLYGEPPGMALLKLAGLSLLLLWLGYNVFLRMEKEFSDYL